MNKFFVITSNHIRKKQLIRKNVENKAKTKKYRENENFRAKIARFLIDCDETKTRIKNSKS